MWRSITERSSGRKRAGLAQDLVGGGDLADVMHRSRGPQEQQLVLVETELGTEERRDRGHPGDVQAGVLVMGLDCQGEALDRLLPRGPQVLDRLGLGGRQLLAQGLGESLRGDVG